MGGESGLVKSKNRGEAFFLQHFVTGLSVTELLHSEASTLPTRLVLYKEVETPGAESGRSLPVERLHL